VTDLEPLWTVSDVMTYLRRGRTWVYDQVANGTMPHLRLGTDGLRFVPSEVRAWALRQRAGATVHSIRYTSP
jgi:predicted DNA-binding transcriptional regulator AlpA